MAEIEYREYRPEDAEEYVAIHDEAFPKVTVEEWTSCSRDGVTAAVAVKDGRLAGAVPFHFRDFRLRPDLSIPAAFEFSVCTRSDLRSQGLGSGMMAKAKELLRGRCLAMMVYRGGESSPGYRYYARNGHHDTVCLRRWQRRGPAGPLSASVARTGYDDFLAREEEVLDVYASAYDAYGGYPQRGPGYYAAAVRTNEYVEVPMELTALWRREPGGRLWGYALLGEEEHTRSLQLLELATLGGDLGTARELLEAFAGLAAERGRPAVAMAASASPYAPVLQVLGFTMESRAGECDMIMAHLHDPEALAAAAWHEEEGSAGLDVVAWTPEREVVLHRARRTPGRKVMLEMKEDSLTRLLLARLELESAWRGELVTAVGAGPAEIAAVARALPFVPWVHHHLDYI